MDIIAQHPQAPFLSAATRLEVQPLSDGVKSEFSRLMASSSNVPPLTDLSGQDLRIWETSTCGLVLRSHKDARNSGDWIIESGEQVLLQAFALCKLQSRTASLPCIVFFLAQKDAKAARLVAQNQDGSTLMIIQCMSPLTENIPSSLADAYITSPQYYKV